MTRDLIRFYNCSVYLLSTVVICWNQNVFLKLYSHRLKISYSLKSCKYSAVAEKWISIWFWMKSESSENFSWQTTYWFACRCCMEPPIPCHTFSQRARQATGMFILHIVFTIMTQFYTVALTASYLMTCDNLLQVPCTRMRVARKL